MSKKPTAPKTPLTRGRAAAALMGALLLIAYSISTGWGGICAAIAATAVTPFSSATRGKARWLPVAAAMNGGLIGGLIQGTEDVPPDGIAASAAHMLQIVGTRALLTGVCGAGAGCSIIATWLWFRRFRNSPAAPPRILVDGVGVLLWAFLYSTIALIAIPGFSGGSGRVARHQMNAAFHNIAFAEMAHFDSTGIFTSSPRYGGEPGLTITFQRADSSQWSATAKSPISTTTCAAGGRRGDHADVRMVCTEHRRWF